MPKLYFERMNLESNIDLVSWTAFDNNELLNLSSYTKKLFPELSVVNSNTSEEEANLLAREVVTKYYNKNLVNMDESVKRYNDIWKKYNNEFFNNLCSYLNIDWPQDKKIIKVSVGIIPVCPRYLNSFSFSVRENMSDSQLIETCAHELCHFLWFEKWKMLFPNYDEKEFKALNEIWEYSEMMVDPILNSKEITKVFNKNARYSYDSFYEKEGLMEKLFEIYNENTSIERKIINGFKYFKNFKQKRK